MTSKNTKMIPFVSLIAATVLLFSKTGSGRASSDSSPYGADEVADALYELEQCVQADEDNRASIDVTSAKSDGMNTKSIGIVQEYIIMQNKLLQEIVDNPDETPQLNTEGKEKFRAFFEKVKYEGLKDRDAQRAHGLDYMLPPAYAQHSCNVDGPHPQPDHATTGNYTDRDAAVEALGSDYVQVPDYASYDEPDDFHDLVNAYDCANGVFRYQTIVFENVHEIWQHSNHHYPGEPNPDVLNYDWPVWWWGFYVYAWHAP